MDDAKSDEIKPKANVFRILLGVVLLVVLGLAGVDRMAAHRWNAAQVTINALVENNQPVEVLHLQQQFGREPVVQADLGASNYTEEIYEWSGGMKIYRLEVVYSPLKYTLNATNRMTTHWYVGNQRPKIRNRIGGDWQSVETE